MCRCQSPLWPGNGRGRQRENSALMERNMQKTQPEDGLKHEVRVHIDQHPYKSPSPTTGVALYALAHVGEGLELFKEVEGHREDAAVPKDGTELHLKEDEHFHSGGAREQKF